MKIVRPTLWLVCTLALGCRARPRPGGPAVEALAFVPPYARGVIDLDLSALRRSAALSRWLAAGADGDCAARLSSRVRRVVVVSLDGGVESLGVVVLGDLPSAAILACARERGTQGATRAASHRGASFTRIEDARGEAEVDVLPNGVALVGPPWVARALLDAGLSYAAGHGEPAVLRAQWDALPAADARLAWLPSRALRASLGVDALRATAAAREAVTLTVTAVAPDEEAALRLAQRGIQWRAETAPALRHAALRSLLDGLRLRADGRAVSATLRVDGPTLTTLGSTLAALAAGL